MSPLQVMVVDDEAPARERLVRLFSQLAPLGDGQPRVTVAHQAQDGEVALELLGRHRVDALFLDIQMPRLGGLALAARWAELPPIVFVTAHAEFAVDAFEVNAVDYLLKPVRLERLAAAVERLAKRRAAKQPQAAEVLKASLDAGPPRVVTTNRGVVRLFNAEQISRFWSNDKYTSFLADGVEQLTEEPLSSLEQRLAGLGFVRVHRGELIALPRVKALRTTDGVCEAVLDDAQVAKVSRRSIAELKVRLGL